MSATAHHRLYEEIVGSQTLVGFHQFPDPTDALPWNERRVGLDHLACGCRDRSGLEAREERLNELGVAHGSIVDAGYGSGLSFRDPDNIALAVCAPQFRHRRERAVGRADCERTGLHARERREDRAFTHEETLRPMGIHLSAPRAPRNSPQELVAHL